MDALVRLALLYSGIFAAMGVQMPFLPAWLSTIGMDARAIGLALAGATAFRVLTVVVGTGAADRFGDLRRAIALSALLAAAAMTCLGLLASEAAAFALLPIASGATAISLAVTEAYALAMARRTGRPYGTIRLWGSAAFIAGTLGGGAASNVLAPGLIIWLIVLPYWWTALAALALPREDGATPPPKRLGETGRLLRDRGLRSVLLAAALIQSSHALLYGFATLQWRADGIDNLTISVYWAIGVVAEIVLFALSGRLALSARAWLAMGAIGAVLRWSLMALDPPAALLPLLQLLHALSFGATYLGAVHYVGRAAPPGLTATAQGLLAMATGIGMSVATAMSGLLAPLGSIGYAVMAATALAGGLVLLMRPPERD